MRSQYNTHQKKKSPVSILLSPFGLVFPKSNNRISFLHDENVFMCGWFWDLFGFGWFGFLGWFGVFWVLVFFQPDKDTFPSVREQKRDRKCNETKGNNILIITY